MSKRSLWMLLGVALIVLVPLLRGGTFGGADGQAAELVAAREGFAPIFAPLWTPPSPEIESLFFALQAALGALILGYVIGYARGRRKAEADQRSSV